MVVAGIGCSSVATPPARQSAEPVADARFLLDPSEGYPRALDPAEARELSAARDRLVAAGDVAGARSLANRLLARDPDLAAAKVLSAEADVVEGRPRIAVERLEPVVIELPEYTAAQVALGLAAERADDIPRALEAYLAGSEASEAAARRAEEIRGRAAEIVSARLGSWLGSGRLEEASAELERLEAWAPDDPLTLAAAASVARASGDELAELAALRRLVPSRAGDADLESRLGLLELEVGDAGEGLRRFESLASRFPGDPEVASGLARARFLWRLQLLPPEVRSLAGKGVLDRSDAALLLYWLFPSLRYGSAGGGRIAADVLDHPHREAIIRVANAGVLEVDDTLHRFDPARPVTRAEMLAGLLRLLALGDPPAACVGVAPNRRRDLRGICEAAARCGLIEEPAVCLPQGPVSGAWAVERSREALQRLGVE